MKKTDKILNKEMNDSLLSIAQKKNVIRHTSKCDKVELITNVRH